MRLYPGLPVYEEQFASENFFTANFNFVEICPAL